MPGRSSHRKLIVLAVLVAFPTEAIGQHHGGRGHGGGWRGGWHGGGVHGYNRAYGGGGYVTRYAYGGYPGYYGGYGVYRPYYGGYAGYPGYYGYGGYYAHHHHHHNDAWIAVGAGVLGVVIGSAIGHRHVYPYGYSTQGPPPPMHQCPDGSTIPAGSYCPEPPAPALPPAPAPPLPGPERG